MKRYAYFTGLIFCILIFAIMISFAFLSPEELEGTVTPEQAVSLSIAALGFIAAGLLVVSSDNESERSNWLDKNDLKSGVIFKLVGKQEARQLSEEDGEKKNYHIIVKQSDSKKYPYKDANTNDSLYVNKIKVGDSFFKTQEGRICKLSKVEDQ